MKKRKKNVIVCLIAFIIVGLLIIGNIMYRRKKNEEFSEVLNYYKCTYYKTSKSKESQYENDVYMKIPYEPVDNQGVSNQYYYEQIIKAVATLVEKNNFRIIDEENNIEIRVRFENGNAKYTINGENNYYETKKASMKTTNNNKIKLNVKADELIQIEENEWKRAETRLKLGNEEKNEDEYDIYESRGFKYNSINLEIFNVIFTKEYKNEVFEGIKTGQDNVAIKKKLGKPNFENEDANMLVGYLTDKYYVFFSNGEISIYRIEQFDKNKNDIFAKIVSELVNDRDYKKFLDKLTDTYPNYAEYNKNENGLEIKYPHLGFKVDFNNTGKNGITLYNNFEGRITEDTSMLDVTKGKTLPSNIYYNNKDGVFEYELKRMVKTTQKNNNSKYRHY